MSLTGIYRQLKPDLNDIEKRLETSITSRQVTVNQAGNQLLKAGGKRIRPVFVLLAAQYGSGDPNRIKQVAVTLELIHMASLVHDDVIDDAELRRGVKTVKAEWDNRVAMYSGDYIFARALDVMTEIGISDAHQVLSNAIVEMTIGEIIQIQDQYDWSQNLRQYLLRIKRKTALLMAVSCWLGARVSEADANICRKLYNLGYFIGMSFQITDDILDFVGTEKQLGKPAASDIRQGNVTLPALIALHNPDHKDELLARLTKEQVAEEDWEYVIQHIKTSGAITEAEALSEAYLEKAYHIIDQLPKNVPATRYLRQIAKYIGTRKY